VNYKKINATLPKDVKPEDVTVEQALEWVEAKAASKGKGKKKTTRKKATKKKKAE